MVVVLYMSRIYGYRHGINPYIQMVECNSHFAFRCMLLAKRSNQQL